jgi:hypothetical protein
MGKSTFLQRSAIEGFTINSSNSNVWSIYTNAQQLQHYLFFSQQQHLPSSI